jgi:hypothetical protein
LPEDAAVCCLGINPTTERIDGRWIYVGMSGPGSSTASQIWVDDVSPGERLEEMHDWFAERMALIIQRVRADGGALPDLLTVIEDAAPEADVLERFRVLSGLLLRKENAVRRIYLSTEHYAFHLPWAGALVACAQDERELAVSVVPSCAFAVRSRQRQWADQPPMSGVIYFDDGDPMLAVAGERMRADIYADSDGDHSLAVEMLADDVAAETSAAPGSAHLDLVIVLSHGSRAAGISSGKLAAPLQHKVRCVLLLGCWSATVAQDTRHMEIEGAVTQFLESGAEAVVASVWPLPASTAVQFGSAFAAALGSGMDQAAALAAAVRVLRLSGGPGSHPAVWGSFALYG